MQFHVMDRKNYFMGLLELLRIELNYIFYYRNIVNTCQRANGKRLVCTWYVYLSVCVCVCVSLLF